MHARLSCEVRGNHLTLAGAIDERVQMPRMLDHAKDQRLVLDLAGVTFINSLGIRSWIRMQQAAEAAQIRLELVRVAEVIVHQLNIMPAARGVSIVTSFYAPYICDRCDLEQTVLLDVRTYGADIARKRPPTTICADCNGTVELAEPPELYFMFLGY